VQLLAGSLAHGQGRFAEAIELCRSAADGLDREAAPSERRFAARFALADVLMAAGDLEGVARQAAVLDEPDAVGNLAARAVGVVAAAGLARAGRFEQGRAVFERALDDPSARALAALEPTFHGYYLELPAGRLDQALAHARRAVSMLEVSDPFGRLPYALTYLMAILEERGEDSEALAVAQRTRAWSQRVGLSGWVGVALAIRSASLRGRGGDVAGAEADLAEVPAEWPVWGEWELEATRAAIDVLHGEGARACAAADRAMDQAERRWPYFDRARCAALLAPTLVSAGHPERAREIVQRTLAGRLPGFSTARLQAVLAWLLHDEGDERASMDALAAAWNEGADQIKHTIRREWPRIERPIWVALEHGAIEIDTTVQALAAAEPGAAALAGFTRHPVAAVRRAALLAAVASGHPQGLERIAELRADPDPTVVRAVNAVAERLVRAPLPLTFRLLGGFGLRRGTWEVQDAEWERRVAQRLIRLLLCRGCGPVLEDELIEAFWPDKTAESARRSIQVAVSAARAVLDPPGAGRSRLVCSERAYRLELTARDTVDAGEFERAASVALAAPPHARRSALLAAAALWTGEPLPEERYSEWSTGWRERLRDRYREVLAALSTAHEHAGYMHEAVAAARAMVELDPLDEAAHRRLIVAFARTGRRGHALRQFLECRRTLVTELGVEPGEETARLQRRVLAGESV
jgi:DNA-binding SARP family transcriptional activator